MSHIVVKRAAHEKERDEVYNAMVEGVPKTTLTLGTRAALLDQATAETVARQLNGMFPGHKWEAISEYDFKYAR